METRKLKDCFTIIKELDTEGNVFSSDSASLESYSSYYKFDFDSINWEGQYTCISDGTIFSKLFGHLVLLFDKNNDYIGYCIPNKKLFIREDVATFY